ncbi:MAG: PilZ domain-containing protein [Clostridiales bacterium]|jgi:hypothetical protein|nr:PilZ domain-containing protein [Clostridiales bacterium]
MAAHETERRLSVRTGLICISASISNDGDNWEKVEGNDISDTGLSFIAQTEYPIGQILELEGVASDYRAIHMTISCDIEIVYTVAQHDGKHFYGARFKSMSKGQHTGLGSFIEQMVTRFPHGND